MAPLDFPLPFLVGREGTRAGLRSRLGFLCRGVAGRGGAGTDGLDIFGRSCKRLRTSFLMCVSSYKASSTDHCCPRRSDMAAQSLRSADKSSWVFTVRRPRLGSGCVRHRSAIFLSKALRFDRCAAWHRARALRNTVWMRVSHPADSEWCSTDTSGASSKKA